MTIYFYGETCRVESHPQGVKKLVLSRPDVRNAFNQKMIEELKEVLRSLAAIEHENELRLLVIEGEGTHFCAGADLNYMKAQAQSSLPENLADARSLGQLFYKLSIFPTPVICAVRGAAIGGGLGLVSCADFVLAEESAVFATSEVTLGIVPGVISPYILRRIGLAHASPFMLAGNRMKAKDCLSSGLVSRTVGESENFSDVLSQCIDQFLAAGPNAARRTKELLLKNVPLPTATIFEYTAKSIAEARCSKEGQEGLNSFFSKVAPPWTKDKKE